MSKGKIFFLTWIFLSPFYLLAADLTIQVNDLRNNKGTLRVYLYEQAKKQDFLASGVKSFACRQYAEIKEGSAKVRCEKVPPGIYALTFFHDENDNFKVDSNFVGIPKEGYGFSLNYKPKLATPSFEEVQFEVTTADQNMILKAIYSL